MKKLIAWLKNGSKILKVLKYIYQALIVANGAIAGGEGGAEEAGISEKITEKIVEVRKYLEVAIEYVGKILEWFGISKAEREALAREATGSPTQLRDKCEEAIS